MENNAKTWVKRYAQQLGIGVPDHAYTEGKPWFSWDGYSFTILDDTRLKITKTYWNKSPKGYASYAFVEVNFINEHLHISEHYAQIDAIAKMPLVRTVIQTWVDGKELGEWTDAQQRETLSYYNIIHTHVEVNGNLIRRVFTLQLKGQ
jgi:hypothetical protein